MVRILRAISALENCLSFMAASTCRARTRLIALAVTSAYMPSSRSQLSQDDPICFFFICA